MYISYNLYIRLYKILEKREVFKIIIYISTEFCTLESGHPIKSNIFNTYNSYTSLFPKNVSICEVVKRTDTNSPEHFWVNRDIQN